MRIDENSSGEVFAPDSGFERTVRTGGFRSLGEGVTGKHEHVVNRVPSEEIPERI
jgi:hypothetical protein